MIEISNADDILQIKPKNNLDVGKECPFSTLSPIPSDFVISVRYLRAQSSGEWVSVGIELTDTIRNLSESRRYLLQTQLFSELNLHRGTISEEKLLEIEQAAQLSAAWQRALSILAYGTNSARALVLKLRQRGFDPQIAEKAVELMQTQGYLRENQDALREAERCLGKGYGQKRIEQYLRQRGYDTDTIQKAVEHLGEVDYRQNCCRVACRYQRTPPNDVKQKQKMIAYLLRYGYTMEEIRYAIEHAWLPEASV